MTLFSLFLAAVTAVPKKKKKIKDLNNKGFGDVLDAFKEVCSNETHFCFTTVDLLGHSATCEEYTCAIMNHLYRFQPEEEKPAPEPEVAQKEPSPAPTPTPPAEELEETWEEKEDKLDTENIEPDASKPVEQKYQYKEG